AWICPTDATPTQRYGLVVNVPTLARQECPTCAYPIDRCRAESEVFRVCGQCGLVFRVTVARLDPSDAWDTNYWKNDQIVAMDAARQSAFVGIVSMVSDLPSTAPRTWLDVGCGGGTLLAAARDVGWEVAGVEPSPAAAEIAAMRAPGAVVHPGSAETDFGDLGTFGVVSMTDVLRYAAEPRGAMQRCAAQVAPGGWLMIRESDSRMKKRSRGAVKAGAPASWSDYAQQFNPRALERAFRELGLAEVHSLPSPLFVEQGVGPTTMQRFALPAVKAGGFAIARLLSRVSSHRLPLTPNFMTVGRKP
ncbi:MAG: class I SAM-dependent methyltransferase, partial [Actinobacteria bacterium]|nr:class I SAM-dependent methyltransferase [Actinomycetota bacterium]